MQRGLMSVLVDLLHNLRIVLDAAADQKEGRSDVMPCQNIQYLRRVARMRAIVKGQRDLAAGGDPMK
jgi:hypothetical protein